MDTKLITWKELREKNSHLTFRKCNVLLDNQIARFIRQNYVIKVKSSKDLTSFQAVGFILQNMKVLHFTH